MVKLIFISIAFITVFIILYLFYKINKMTSEIKVIKSKLLNLEKPHKKLPKKQTGFGTGRAKDEHTVSEHDIYHY
jgi:hypothetical protein